MSNLVNCEGANFQILLDNINYVIQSLSLLDFKLCTV